MLDLAEAILSLIVSDLTRQGLDDCDMVSQESQEYMHTLSFLLDNAKHAIQCIQSSGLNLHNARLLTGFCAIMCPVTGNDGCDAVEASTSLRHFSRLFGINRKAKYVTRGVKNRLQFNRLLEPKGDIVAGERVSCSGNNHKTTGSKQLIFALR